jgi:hypothetical protein
VILLAAVALIANITVFYKTEVLCMSKKKKLLATGCAVLVLIVFAGATLAFAQGPDTLGDTPVLTEEAQGPWARLRQRVRRWQNMKRGREIMDSALAGELEISVEELQEARLAARPTALEQAAEEGLISEERAQFIIARLALAGTLEEGQLAAQALGLTLEEFEAARAEGQTIRDLLFELDLTPAELRENLLAAYEEAIEQAFLDGALTRQQADLLLERPGQALPRPIRPPRPNNGQN